MNNKPLLLSLGLALQPAVAAADFLILGTSEQAGRISGYDGTLMKVNVGEFTYREDTAPLTRPGYLTADKGVEHTVYMGITGIEWWERADKPCRIQARSLSLDPTIGKASSNDKSICNGDSGNGKSVSFVGSRNYLRAVAACTNDKKDSSNNRLKGLRIYPARVDADGTVTALSTYEEVRHTNCPASGWHPVASCPAGHIATGLRVHHNGDWFRGISLKCRLVTKADSPYKP